MFFQQSFTVLSKAAVPLIAPVALVDLGASASYVGVYVAIAAAAQTLVGVGCGNFIRRYGGLRVSQVGMFFVLMGMILASMGVSWLFVLTALFVALGTGAGTPASSHILARYSPPQYAPMIFGAKQTAVPVGLAAGGFVIPFLYGLFGWQGALLCIGIMCAGFAIVLQPARAELDKDRNPKQALSMGDMKSTFLVVLRTPSLRILGITMFAFVGLQNSYTAYIVLFLTTELGYSFAEASSGIFAMAMAAAIPTRVLWGYIASSWVSPRNVLAGLGVTMTIASVLTGFYGPEWPFWQILGVAIVFTATGLGWQGVLLSEIARCAPPGQVGMATGGVMSFASAGMTVMPLIFSAILALTGSYHFGFYVIGIPTLGAALMLIVVEKKTRTALLQKPS
jgi:MFS family permease